MGLLRQSLQELRSKQSAAKASVTQPHDSVFGIRGTQVSRPAAPQRKLPPTAANHIESHHDLDSRT